MEHNPAPVSDTQRDRRNMTRRADDYFWLQRLCDVTGDGCIVVDRDQRIEYSDPRASALLEVPQESLEAGRDFSELTLHLGELGYFGPGDPRAFQALLGDMLTNQRLKDSRAEYTVQVTTPMSSHINLCITYGRDDRFIVVIRDRTEAVLEERALSAALKIGESGYWNYNIKTREFQIRGGQFFDVKGFDAAEADSVEEMRKLLHPDDFEETMRVFHDCIRKRAPRVVTSRCIMDDGDTRWLKSHLMPNVDEGNRVRSVTCFFHDVTVQLRSQDQLRTAQQSAERALKAKTAFLGRLSHEIRTPMNAVIGMADAIIHHHNDPDINPKLELIQDSAEKIVRLVDETLQHSKLEAREIELDPRDASPRVLAERLTMLWTEQAQKVDTELRLRCDDTVPELMVFDDFRLEQCLNNILSNAVKFTTDGVVEIILTTAGDEDSRHLVVAVRDTGIGMSEAQLKQVFLPYKQADKSISSRYGGTGLGMSITKDLVELLGGRITVRSEEGKGTTFILTLPVIEPSSDAVGSDSLVGQMLEAAEDKEERTYDHLRVLIVDDNATNHMVIGSLLKDIVGETATAMNGEEAIARLREDGPFDVVLMDIHMPVMDGIEATLAIRSGTDDFADVPIIALTADPQYQQARLCRNIGMDDALAKPVRLSQILTAFDEVLATPVLELDEAA